MSSCSKSLFLGTQVDADRFPRSRQDKVAGVLSLMCVTRAHLWILPLVFIKASLLGLVPAHPLTADFLPRWLTLNLTECSDERLLPSLEKLGIAIAFWTCAHMMCCVLCRILRGLMGNIEVEKNIKTFPKQNHELELKCR